MEDTFELWGVDNVEMFSDNFLEIWTSWVIFGGKYNSGFLGVGGSFTRGGGAIGSKHNGGGGGCRPEHSTLGLGETLENVKLIP